MGLENKLGQRRRNSRNLCMYRNAVITSPGSDNLDPNDYFISPNGRIAYRKENGLDDETIIEPGAGSIGDEGIFAEVAREFYVATVMAYRKIRDYLSR